MVHMGVPPTAKQWSLLSGLKDHATLRLGRGMVLCYNVVLLLQIVGRPLWWIFLLIIPGINLIVGIILFIDLAKSYGKDTMFALGLIALSPLFLPILAFGSAQYQGPAALADGGDAPAGDGGDSPAGDGGDSPSEG